MSDLNPSLRLDLADLMLLSDAADQIARCACSSTSTSLLIHAGNTKTLKTRTVPIVPAVRPWLEFVPLAITAEGIKTAWQRARIDAGLPGMNFHDLRHSCASILIASGADLFTVSKILGHASTRTTERYAHMQVEQQRKAMTKAFKGK